MANIKISELNPLLTVEDADVLPIVDNAITKKVTAAILRSYTQGNSVLLTGNQTVAGIKTFTSQLASSVATGTAPFSVASTTKVTNLNADLLDGLSSADFQAPLSGTGIVKSTAGTISYLTDNSTNWNTAFNDKINSAAVTGIGTNTLTLTQQDAGTITATWVNGTLIREIRNTTGATLTKGTIVYISGATGNKPTVTKAIATGDETSAQTFGFVQENIANNANGYVVIIGDLVGIDTSAYAEGAQLYLSSTTAGTFTTVKQYAPNHLVYVGIVTRSHPTLGQIEVNIQNGFEMDELHNVAAQNPSNGDILQYVTSTGLWTKIGGTTSAISEGSNLYFTNARSRSAISLTTTGTSGAATYNSTTGVLNIPNYADTDTGITSLNGLTALTQTFAVGTSGTDFGISSATSTHTFNLPTASATNRGALSSADWTTFNNKQNALTNPITGTGTTNYLPKFTGASALGNSIIQENATGIGIGGSANYSKLEIVGATTSKRLGIGTNVYLTNSMDILALSDIGADIPLGISGQTIGLYTNGAILRMLIGSTGAATFYNNVTAQRYLTNYSYFGNGDNYNIKLNNDLSADSGFIYQLGGSTAIASNSYYNSAGLYTATATTASSIELAGGATIFYNNSGLTSGGTFGQTERFRIAANGAATFSSSVTGAGLILTTNDSVFSTLGSITKHSTIGLALRAATGDVFDYSLYSVAGDALITNPTGTNRIVFNSGTTSFASDATINGVRVGVGAGNVPGNIVVGNSALNANTTGIYNSAVGQEALKNNTTGGSNTGIGGFAAFSNTTGSNNTAVGYGASYLNTTGSKNVAIGDSALVFNTASNNVAVGYEAANSNTSGAGITAIGYQTLKANTTGVNNIALGNSVLIANTIGENNIAMGNGALYSNVSANNNTALGHNSLLYNTAANNTAVGYLSGLLNTTGSENTTVGRSALENNTTGGQNTALGFAALYSNTTGSKNIGIGYFCESGNYSNNIIIGYDAIATGNNQFVVGSAGVNAGTVATEVNASTKVWNVRINGVAQKILLA